MKEKKHLLYGIDNEEGIVSIETLHNQNVVEIFSRKGGILSRRYEPFSYLVYTTNKSSLYESLSLFDVEVVHLKGNNHYNVLLKTNDQATYKKIKFNYKDEILIPYIQSQYMIQTGKTCFKDSLFSEVKSFCFDIEVMTKEGFSFPNYERIEDEIVMIATRTSDGFVKVLTQDNSKLDLSKLKCIVEVFPNEKKLLEGLVKEIRTYDPDVLYNHNIFNFDITYIKNRCKLRGVEFKIGRDGSEPSYFDTQIKFADRSLDYTNCSVYGRAVIDTMFLAMYADVVLRDMPSYNLKDLVKYLGKEEENRTYIEGGEISSVWKGSSDKFDVNDLINYASSDVKEADILYHEYGMSTFTMTQMIPMNYQEVFRYGTGNQIEAVFMREYYRQNHSYPKASPKRRYGGGYAAVVQFGLVNEPIIYADVKSLYPSLAKMLKIQPKKDELLIFQDILLLLMSLRFEMKDNMKSFTEKIRQNNKEIEELKKKLDKSRIEELEKENKQFKDSERQINAEQSSVKIFLNTMSYGYIGWEFGSFNDYEEAERITTNGQMIVKKMKELIDSDGGKSIKIDTDGIACVVPKEFQGSLETEKKYIDTLTKRMPDGIEIEHDGRYAGILAVDGKSYALLEYNGKIKIKGNTLRGRNIENFGIQFIKDCISYLFNKEFHKCKEAYNYWKNRITNYEVTANEIAKKNSLNNSLEEYKNKVMSGSANRSVQYELALKADREYIKGDVVVYYIKQYPMEFKFVHKKMQIKKQKMPSFEAGELIENYNNDIEVSYYLERLDEITKKFVTLGKEMFEDIFEVRLKPADIRKYEKTTQEKYEEEYPFL